MSQRDLAPSRGGPKMSSLRDDGSGSAKSSTRIVEGAEMTGSQSYRALCDRKFVDAARGNARGVAEEDGHVEVILQQHARFNRPLVAAINENDALTRKTDERNFGLGDLCRGNQRGHFGTGIGGLVRPTCGLA